MADTSARLLRLLALLQARGFWSGEELAERLEVTTRTVRRDVDRLRALGYPVRSSVGVAGGYQLGAGASLPPLLLEDEEALAVAIGLRTAASGGVAGVEPAALRALAKLEQVLPAKLRKRVDALNAAVAPLYFEGPRVRPSVLASLALASRGHRVATFHHGGREGPPRARTTEPHGLVHTGSRWYLVAFDLDRDDWRTFRVDRITDEPRLGDRFVPRDVPGGSLARFVSRSVATRPYPYVARVVIDAPREAIAARISPSTGVVERIDDSHCRLELGGGSLEGLARYLALVDHDFVVVDPPELREHLRRLAKRLRRAARPA